MLNKQHLQINKMDNDIGALAMRLKKTEMKLRQVQVTKVKDM